MSEYDELLGVEKKPNTAKFKVQPLEIRTVPKIMGKTCRSCEQYFGTENFLRSNSWFFRDGYLEICNDCLRKELGNGEDLQKADKFCQYADVPFDPGKWIELLDVDKFNWFKTYFTQYWSRSYEGVDWKVVHDKWQSILHKGEEDSHIDLLQQEVLSQLRKTWGPEYTNEQLLRFEQLYKDIEATQSITTALQQDAARKMCMLSYKIEQAIWDEELKAADAKALIGSYNDLAKAADFTPKTAKNVGDFDSVGEFYTWLEKRGWKNTFYNWTPRDEVDKVMKIIQLYTKRIVIGETNIAEELNEKLDMVKNLTQMEDEYLVAADSFEETSVDDDLTEELGEDFEVES